MPERNDLVAFEDGTVVSVVTSGGQHAPDSSSQTPTPASIWVLHDQRWWTTQERSLSRLISDLGACRSFEEARNYEVVGPESEAKR